MKNPFTHPTKKTFETIRKSRMENAIKGSIWHVFNIMNRIERKKINLRKPFKGDQERVNKFLKKIIQSQKDCPSEFIDIVNKEFWNLMNE
jgi:hypothetical protein